MIMKKIIWASHSVSDDNIRSVAVGCDNTLASNYCQEMSFNFLIRKFKSWKWISLFSGMTNQRILKVENEYGLACARRSLHHYHFHVINFPHCFFVALPYTLCFDTFHHTATRHNRGARNTHPVDHWLEFQLPECVKYLLLSLLLHVAQPQLLFPQYSDQRVTTGNKNLDTVPYNREYKSRR